MDRFRTRVRCNKVLEEVLERGTLLLCSAASDILRVRLEWSSILVLLTGAILREEGSWKVV